jgi:hypothetical protein
MIKKVGSSLTESRGTHRLPYLVGLDSKQAVTPKRSRYRLNTKTFIFFEYAFII